MLQINLAKQNIRECGGITSGVFLFIYNGFHPFMLP